jgi:type II secretory pathway component GspD/PulD (secretin)
MSPNLTRSVCALVLGSLVVASTCWAGESGKDAKSQTTPSTVTMECKVVFVKHVDCKSAAEHVRSLFQGEDDVNKATWFRPTKAILLRSTPEEVQQMEYLISQIDVAQPEVKEAWELVEEPVQELRLFTLQYAKASQLAELLAETIQPDSSRRSSIRRMRICSDERTNVLVLLATKQQLAKAWGIVKALDVPVKPQTTGDTLSP